MRRRCWGGLALTLFWVAFATGCATTGERVRAHGDPAHWGRALVAQVTEPKQALAHAAIAGSWVGLDGEDERIARDLTDDPIFSSGKERDGDAAIVGLAGLAGISTLLSAYRGDEGRSFEVLAETSVLSEFLVIALKDTVRRSRPGDSNSVHSFPSGHATTAFYLATYLARRSYDELEGWPRYLGYLAYVPAAFTAVNRVEAGKHYPTDVAAAALVGTFLMNWIYDAHYGDEEEGGVFGPVRVAPMSGPDRVGLRFELDF